MRCIILHVGPLNASSQLSGKGLTEGGFQPALLHNSNLRYNFQLLRNCSLLKECLIIVSALFLAQSQVEGYP
jgi:hypothetical protein